MALAGCATAPFDRYVAEERWDEASRVFSGDSALANNERLLYIAAVLYGTPTRSTYDLDRSRKLFRAYLSKFPKSSRRGDARDRLAMLDEIAATRDSSGARARIIEARVASLMADVQRLRASIDSTAAASDGLRRSAGRLENELREHDEQLRALRLELRQLKEIDLKPRRPPR